MDKKISPLSRSIGNDYTKRALIGFGILIPLMIYVFGHALLDIPLIAIIVLAVVCFVVYVKAIYKFWKEEL